MQNQEGDSRGLARINAGPARSGPGIATHGDPRHPALVLLHGFMGSAADWEPVCALLAPRHFCVAIDLPGHGRSVGLDRAAYTLQGAAQLVIETLEGVNIRRCALAGYSMGGRLALTLALQDPARWSHVALVAASPGLEDGGARSARSASDEALAARLEGGSFPDFLDEWYRQPLFASLWENTSLRDAVLRRRLQNSPAELARALRGMGAGVQPSLWGKLGRLGMPLRAVAGERDRKYADLARRMEGLCRRCRRVIVPAAGHAVHLEAPEALSRCLEDLLAASATV